MILKRKRKNYERRKELLQEQQAISAERERVKALPNGSPEKQASLLTGATPGQPDRGGR